ncbi:hypothetical protein HHL16_16310 [Pseudoflavitalea sp. G-6-1-2]|uniref:hypothetical protein n=1 Tax=Pseudoflavitalea sp. G-6-1-2 TaxID=2728841 RepID=UPI00146C3C9D|nr:hypothetical protein [Pseudoflavitalea sp. G-6-1-2]NML22449.1 hypothetical protein [Pseudoflavitalea sp. G-6-1-2]
MKTILITSVLVLLLFSCRTVQRATEDQFTDYKRTVSAAQNTAQKKLQESSQVKFTNMAAVSRSDNGIERLIEEEVLEFSVPRKDSLISGGGNKVVKTTRKIREREQRKERSVQQLSGRDSLRKRSTSQTDQAFQLNEAAQQRRLQHRQMVRKTGVPWYVWAGSAVTVTFSFWFGNRIRQNRAAIRPWQNFEP